MKFKTKYKLCLTKRYFDTGYSLTNYMKYFIAFFGLASRDIQTTMIIGFSWVFACFFIGWIWIKYKFIEAEQEVTNQFNLFVKEMRKKIK